jgi:hypothetical protein
MGKVTLRKSTIQMVQQFQEEDVEDSLVFDFGSSRELKEPPKSQEFKEPSKKYHVEFDSAARMRHTIHVDDYTDDEYFACWYTPEELQDMKGDLLDTLHRLERKEIVDEVNDTFRGLETHTQSGKRCKRQSRSTAIETVVGMVYKQSKAGKSINAECVAASYKECNKPSELAAYLSGIGDQAIVRDLDMSFNTEVVRQNRGRRRCGFAMVSQ